LQQGHQSSNVALHLNPRFEGGNRVIVLNHKSGKWGSEKRITGAANPFYPNGYFQVII
jgi:Galactoside-binding lectin